MGAVASVGLVVLGSSVVLATFISAVTTVVVPRGVPVRLTRVVFLYVRRVFELRTRYAKTYEQRDRAMALFAPFTLVGLPLVWLALVGLGFSFIFAGLGVRPFSVAFQTAGSSMLTLGIKPVNGLAEHMAAFLAAAIGLLLVALLITYLPSMYAAFGRREALVALIAIQAGTPPTPVELLSRFHTIRHLDQLEAEVWRPWIQGFVDIEETHTSLGALPFFRSPYPERSWATAAGTVLDSASLLSSTVDIERTPGAQLCVRAGFLCLRRIADFYGIENDHDPAPTDPISVTRDEYDAVVAQLAASGVPVKADREQAWRDFVGWRVNYDTVLLRLAGMVMAPSAQWTSDRSPVGASSKGAHRPPLMRGRRK